MLTNPNNYDILLNDIRGTDFLYINRAFSRCRKPTVSLMSTEQSPFYLEMDMPIKKCENCGKEFRRTSFHLNQKHFTCSVKCWSAYTKTRLDKTRLDERRYRQCSYCGNLFYKAYPSKFLKVFCN